MKQPNPEQIKTIEERLKNALIELGISPSTISERGAYSAVLQLSSGLFERLTTPGVYFDRTEIVSIRKQTARL